MEGSDIEAVLHFLRKNHLSISESALIHDIVISQNHLPSLPLPLSLPPLKLKPHQSSQSDDASSHHDFLSFASSSSSHLCLSPSDFTNPYGATSHSHASSDSCLSQFGTARDFHMQNDLEWYTQKDQDHDAFPSCSDPFDGDRFVMPLEKENHQLVLDPIVDPTHLLDKVWPAASIGYLKDDIQLTDDYDNDIKSATLSSSLKGFVLNDLHDLEEDDLIGIPKTTLDRDVDFNLNTDYDAAKVEEGETIATDDESLKNEYQVFDLRIIHRKNRTGFEENKDLPIVLNSVLGSRYVVTEYLGSAAFSKVVQARDLQTGVDVCLKIIKNDKDFFDQSLDEIKLLKLVNKHDPADEHHILRLYDYFYFHEHLIIVCELLRANLYEFQKYNRESGGEPYFTMTRLQVITRQCLEALDYLHGLGIIHCDLKPENILMKSYSRCEIKVIDLGSSCFLNDKLSLYVQSRSYRAPEVIIGLPYDQKVDLWSLGCILAELSSGDVLFPNDALVLLLARVIGMLGPIDADMLARGQETSKYFTDEFDLYRINEETKQLEYIIPQETSLEEHIQVSDTLFIDFVRELLEINPQRRPTAREALKHPWLSVPYQT